MTFARRAALSGSATSAFVRLSEAVRGTPLLDTERASTDLPDGGVNSYLGGLTQVARRHRQWVRTPEALGVSSAHTNAPSIFAHVVRHHFARYHVPRFLDEAWFDDASPEQDWAIAMAQGRSLRGQRMPIPMTRRMLHHFANGPRDLSIRQVLRWAQVRAIGGSDRTARLLARTRLSEWDHCHAYWERIIGFLVAHQDDIHNHEFAPLYDFFARRAYLGHRFNLRGRSLAWLRSEVADWRRVIATRYSERWDPDTAWDPCSIHGLERTNSRSPGATAWRIEELTTAARLAIEGRSMRHCVGSYVGRCASGHSAIFSMSRTGRNGDREARLTIEVDPRTRCVVQARGHDNVMPRPAEQRILQEWAEESRLTLRYARE